MRALLDDAATVVGSGWLQHHWFAVTDTRGRGIRVSGHNIADAIDHPVSDACLVGAIVQAAGGPTAVSSQLVQRTLDLTWHTLYETANEPVRWCPPPSIRIAHVRDLTRWNDHPQRMAGHVSALLHSAQRTADAQTELLRA